MRDSSTAFAPPFQALLDRIADALAREDLPAAEEAAEHALIWAERHSDQEARDRAESNLVGFSILRADPSRGAAASLQRVLMRSRSLGTRYVTANYLSLLYDQRRLYDKSLFYAQLALESAQQAGDPAMIRKAWNRIGNVQIVQSLFKEAYETYGTVLSMLGPQPEADHAIIGANIGYCLLMLEEHRAGYRKLIETRRLVRRLGHANLEARIGLRLSICYAYIELGRLDLAHRHGMAALEQGEANENPELIEKALYLLGEVAKKAGDEDLAFDLFDRLESTFHPDQVGLADLLMAVESHRLVNLRA